MFYLFIFDFLILFPRSILPLQLSSSINKLVRSITKLASALEISSPYSESIFPSEPVSVNPRFHLFLKVRFVSDEFFVPLCPFQLLFVLSLSSNFSSYVRITLTAVFFLNFFRLDLNWQGNTSLNLFIFFKFVGFLIGYCFFYNDMHVRCL